MKLALATICTALAWAQTPEIRGVVIEPGIEHGVPDAEIAVYELGGTPLTGLGRNIRRQAGRVTTDSQGKFRFQPEQFGEYQVIASKEGYSGNAAGANVALSADHPSREVRFLLGRTGEITGRVVDEETGEPVVNYTIEAAGFFYKNGVPRTAGSGTLANTDNDGRFTVADLDPGRYVVVTHPRMRGLTRSSGTELEAQDYEWSYWPGGRGLGSAAPITLISGGSTDVGVLKLRKAPLYRVQVAISDLNCPANERVQVSVLTVASPLTATYGSSEGACGEELLLWNFRPGSYGLVLTHGQEPDRSMASLTFDVVNKDLNLTASLARVTNVEGRLVAADGAGKIPFEKLKIMPVEITRTGTQFDEQPGPASVDSEGRFQLMSRSPFGKFLIWLLTTDGAGDYVKEIRFNGVIVTGNPITLNASAVGQSLEIVVDDQPATITGVVSDGDHPVSKPYVLLTKWPMPAELAYARPQGSDGDDDGHFRFTELVPGEYRAIAVSQSNRDMLDEPGVLQRLLTGMETITLSRGGVQAITLKLVDPSR
ncbi:MAG: carboxypeptidase regulatory-like domain-containing protein [Acidobacteriia bacterium]|nr:carboxypeptidase regulatory-like domain-containing protein [Terriglobia bacterium]